MSKRGGKRARAGRAPPAWFGAIFIIAGCCVAAIGAGWIPVDPDSVHAPGWVIVLVGGVFALGGVMCHARHLDDRLNQGLALLMMIAFATVFSWVAFGPGEREFSGGVSVGPVGGSGRGSEGLGRTAFGLGALLCWAIVAAIAVQWFRGMRRGEREGP